MAKTVINIRTSDIGKFNDNDLLIYDKAKDEFYRTTADNFYKPYEIKLDELKKKYDADFEKMKNDNEEFKNQVKEDMRDLVALVKNLLKAKGE